jgi:hypothetical protein
MKRGTGWWVAGFVAAIMLMLIADNNCNNGDCTVEVRSVKL